MLSLKTQSIIAVAVFGLTAGYADAQSDFYSRDKYEAVKDRRQAEFDPDPVRLGAFVVNSDATIGVATTDNVFASNGNTPEEAEESDVIYGGSAGARARTDWTNHEIALRGRISHTEFSDFSDESFTDVTVGASGRLDVSRELNIRADVDHINSVQSRANYADGGRLDAPIDTNRTSFAVSANYLNDRFQWNNTLRLTEAEFENGLFRDTNTVLEQDFRNNQRTELSSRIAYAISPNIAVYGLGTASQTEFDKDQTVFDPETNTNVARSRDSDGYTVAVGVDFETNNLVRGDIAVGFFSEDKKDEAFEDVDGLSVDGRAQWFPSRLTTVTFNAGRSVVDNGLVDSPSTVQTRFGVEVDHEFSRQVIGTVFGNIAQDEYQEITREDELTRIGAGVTYKLNKRVHFTGSLQNVNRDVSGIDPGFDPSFSANEIGFSISFFP